MFGRSRLLISALGSQVDDAPIDDDNDRAFDIDNDGRRWGAGQKLETGRGETKKLTLLQERWEHRCPLWTIRQMKACVTGQGWFRPGTRHCLHKVSASPPDGVAV